MRLEAPVLWIGPEADDNQIATIACRCSLERDGDHDETHVAELVADEGFAYVAPTDAPVSSGVRSASPAVYTVVARTVG